MHKVLEFTSENPAVKNMFYFIFFDPIMDYRGWQCNMLMCSLQGRGVENQPVFEGSFTPETVAWQ